VLAEATAVRAAPARWALRHSLGAAEQLDSSVPDAEAAVALLRLEPVAAQPV